jgi:hypothetical protein
MSLPLSVLNKPEAHAVATAVAHRACAGCRHSISVRESLTHCEAKAGVVRHVGDICPLSVPLFDHRLVPYISICKSRVGEEWSREWQGRLRGASLRRSRVVIPRELYDEAMQNRNADHCNSKFAALRYRL